MKTLDRLRAALRSDLQDRVARAVRMAEDGVGHEGPSMEGTLVAMAGDAGLAAVEVEGLLAWAQGRYTRWGAGGPMGNTAGKVLSRLAERGVHLPAGSPALSHARSFVGGNAERFLLWHPTTSIAELAQWSALHPHILPILCLRSGPRDLPHHWSRLLRRDPAGALILLRRLPASSRAAIGVADIEPAFQSDVGAVRALAIEGLGLVGGRGLRL